MKIPKLDFGFINKWLPLLSALIALAALFVSVTEQRTNSAELRTVTQRDDYERLVDINQTRIDGLRGSTRVPLGSREFEVLDRLQQRLNSAQLRFEVESNRGNSIRELRLILEELSVCPFSGINCSEDPLHNPRLASCHPAYTGGQDTDLGGCIRFGIGDYDCISTDGDGPHYAKGPTLTETDPFQLDADGDGVGCDES